MIKHIAKIMIVIIASALCLSTSAYACDTIDNHRTVFQTVMPDIETIDPNEEFVGEVTIRRKAKWFIFKQDKSAGLQAYVHTSLSHPGLQGELINLLPINETSCGPYVEDGERGNVRASIIKTRDGNDVFYLQTQRVGFIQLQSPEKN